MKNIAINDQASEDNAHIRLKTAPPPQQSASLFSALESLYLDQSIEKRG
jgi:hypothetical protein